MRAKGKTRSLQTQQGDSGRAWTICFNFVLHLNITVSPSLHCLLICRSRRTECSQRGVCAAVAPRGVAAASSPTHLRQTSASSPVPPPHHHCSLPHPPHHCCRPLHPSVEKGREEGTLDYFFCFIRHECKVSVMVYMVKEYPNMVYFLSVYSSKLWEYSTAISIINKDITLQRTPQQAFSFPLPVMSSPATGYNQSQFS